MNIRRIWLIIPAVLMPYFVLATWIMGLSLVENSDVDFLFNTFLVYPVLALLMVLICCALCLIKKWDAISFSKAITIAKILQVPAYAVIFAIGFVAAIIPVGGVVALTLMFLDFIALIMTGLLYTAAVINANKQYGIKLKNDFFIIILQFFFCVDVIAAIGFYIYLRYLDAKRKRDKHLMQPDEIT